MQRLTPVELETVSGGSRFTHSAQAAACAILGLSVGALIGTQYGSLLAQTFLPGQGYTAQLKNYVIDTAIAHEMGAYGIHNQMDLLGGLVGSFVGCITGSALFGSLIA